MFHKNFKSQCFFLKIHFMDSHINKVHSPTIFCIVLSDLMGFWDTYFLFRSHASSHTIYLYMILRFMTGLKFYFWLRELLCHQVYISRRTAKILGAQQKMLGAQLKILGAPVPTEKQNLRHYYVIFSFLYFIFVPCLLF